MAFIKTVVFALAAFIVVNGLPQFNTLPENFQNATEQWNEFVLQLPVNTTARPVDQSQSSDNGTASEGEEGEGSTGRRGAALNRLTNITTSYRQKI
jgi:hypothetical protein